MESVGDESLSSSSESRREQLVDMVKTGIETVPGKNKDKMQGTGRAVASHPTTTGEKIREENTTVYRSSDILLNIACDVDKKNVLSRESTSERLGILLGEGSRALIVGNFRLAVSKFQEVAELKKYSSHVFDDSSKYIWFQYAYFMSLVEVDSFPDLINAQNSLSALKDTLHAELPTYHYAAAKLLIKFNRFQLAEEEIQKSRDAMVGHDFKTHFWPFTEEVIKEATQDGLEKYLEDLITKCKGYHVPDATCKFEGCLSASSHPYPSRDIFHSDPDFKGYVVLTCQEGCKVHYHPQCWKNIKETFTNLDKLSDKECVGKPCLTPDCKNSDGGPSILQKIEIFGSDGHIKSTCVVDLGAEIRQKEIALKKRQRQISDELKNEKLASKIKQKNKKIPEHNHASEVLPSSTKNPVPKDNKPLQITGVASVKQNMPAKEKSYREMDTLAGQKEFICSYFTMLVNTSGPLSKDKVEDEWGKFYPIFKPMAGLVTKNCGIFNLLKKSGSFVVEDDHLCIKESSNKKEDTKEGSVGDVKSEDEKEENTLPAADCEETPKPPNTLKSLKQTEKAETLESVKIVPPLPLLSDFISSKDKSSHKDWAMENKVVDSEISEIENELRLTSLLDKTSKSFHNSSELLNSKLLDSSSKDRTNASGDQASHNYHIPINKPPSFFEDSRNDKKPMLGTTLDHQKLAGIPFHKSSENVPMMPQHPEGFFFIPPHLRGVPTMMPPLVPPPPLPGSTALHWPVDGLQPQKPMQFGNQEMIKPMMIFPTPGGLDPSFGFPVQNRRDISIQTDEKWEEKNSGDETWVQHMQLAVNELLKKNKDLAHSKEELINAHQKEVEALKNQMLTLRQSYEQYIESLKESLNKSDDDRRRGMGLEQRMKLQEQILNSTREELRNKDFDLLEAKKLLGVTILERMESGACKQVARLVTALASLPCNSKEAEAVGQAMAKWEETGNSAAKAKGEFLAACMRHQAKLIAMTGGYGSDNLKDLQIPVVEEPSGVCPLDSLTLKLLHEKESAGLNNEPFRMNQGRTSMAAPTGVPPFRNRNATPDMSVSTASSSFTPIPAPLSPASLGARPRDSSVGDPSMNRWPSSHSVHSISHSSSGGNPRGLSNFRKLLIELKRCFPSRTEDELCSAIKLARRKNKNSLSGLTIEKIVTMVGNVLEWWPEPIDGSMGLDKFMGWASDVTPADETFCSVSKPPQSSAWMSNTCSPRKEGDKDDCCICLQGMSEPKTELICSHSFHTQCIRKWLSKESVCPICRKFTRMPDEFPTLK
ncbi:uncharacterized protein LOC124160623 isoform X2 [Ischnura elegans]|uniref:uncharacterized protein LOC124160623 isoform X2 n=1 Tax=Ischnura elegans TaxID=197161 RepID=UPI001ED868B8|nr:uncharacterized protein LOC124160623 isoform X2 [Ischnura elegans]